MLCSYTPLKPGINTLHLHTITKNMLCSNVVLHFSINYISSQVTKSKFLYLETHCDVHQMNAA